MDLKSLKYLHKSIKNMNEYTSVEKPINKFFNVKNPKTH